MAWYSPDRKEYEKDLGDLKSDYATYMQEYNKGYIVFKSYIEYYLYCPQFAHMMLNDTKRYRKLPVMYNWPYKKSIQKAYLRLMSKTINGNDLTLGECESMFLSEWNVATKRPILFPPGMKESDVIIKASNTLYNAVRVIPYGAEIVRSGINYVYPNGTTYKNKKLFVSGRLTAVAYRTGRYNIGNLFVISALYPMRHIPVETIRHYIVPYIDLNGARDIRTDEYKNTFGLGLIWVDLRDDNFLLIDYEDTRTYSRTLSKDIHTIFAATRDKYTARNVGEHCGECYHFNNCIKTPKYEVIR